MIGVRYQVLALTSIYALDRSSIEGEEATDEVDKLEEKEVYSDASSGDLDLEDDDSHSGRSTTPRDGAGAALSDIVFMLADIAHIVSCLYNLRVSIALEQPVRQDRLRKYAEIDVLHYKVFDKQHVLEKFKFTDTNHFLISRLGNANTQRRQYFRYRLLHHAKIARGLESTAPYTKIEDEPVASGAELPDANLLLSVTDHSTQDNPLLINQSRDTATVITGAMTSTTISIVPGSAVVRTQSAIDDVVAESDGGQTATSFGTIMDAGTVTLLRVPAPPNADYVFAGNPFQCPYCYTLIQVNSSKAWRYVSEVLVPTWPY